MLVLGQNREGCLAPLFSCFFCYSYYLLLFHAHAHVRALHLFRHPELYFFTRLPKDLGAFRAAHEARSIF